MVFFHKRNKAVPPEVRQKLGIDKMTTSGFLRIDYDMMRKGNIAMRKRTPIRQFCVTVDGASRLVTSGDTVDRKTYLALVAAGAIDPIPEASPVAEPTPIDDAILEKAEPID